MKPGRCLQVSWLPDPVPQRELTRCTRSAGVCRATRPRRPLSHSLGVPIDVLISVEDLSDMGGPAEPLVQATRVAPSRRREVRSGMLDRSPGFSP